PRWVDEARIRGGEAIARVPLPRFVGAVVFVVEQVERFEYPRERARLTLDCGAYCPWLDAANNFWPVLVSTTDVAFPSGRPLLALKPSTVISSPAFIELRVQPARSSPFGPPISMPQLVTFPVSSFTSM